MGDELIQQLVGDVSITMKKLQGLRDLLNCKGWMCPEGSVLVVIQDLFRFVVVVITVHYDSSSTLNCWQDHYGLITSEVLDGALPMERHVRAGRLGLLQNTIGCQMRVSAVGLPSPRTVASVAALI